MNPDLYAVIEPALVILIVGASALISLRKIAPGLLSRFGRLLKKSGAPAPVAGLFEAQSGGCGGCSNCGTSQETEATMVQRSKNCGA